MKIKVHARQVILTAIRLNKLLITFCSHFIRKILDLFLCINILDKEVVGDSEDLSQKVLSVSSCSILIQLQHMVTWLHISNSVSN